MWEVRRKTLYDPQSDTHSAKKFHYLLMHSALSVAMVLRQSQPNSTQSWWIVLTSGLEAWHFCWSLLDLWTSLQITCLCTKSQQGTHLTAIGEDKNKRGKCSRVLQGSACARMCNIPLLKDSHIARIEIIGWTWYTITWHSSCVWEDIMDWWASLNIHVPRRN